MCHGMRNPHELRVRRYTDCLIELNEYLELLPGEKTIWKIGTADLNDIVLNSMPSSWSNQAYMQGFDCEYIT